MVIGTTSPVAGAPSHLGHLSEMGGGPRVNKRLVVIDRDKGLCLRLCALRGHSPHLGLWKRTGHQGIVTCLAKVERSCVLHVLRSSFRPNCLALAPKVSVQHQDVILLESYALGELPDSQSIGTPRVQLMSRRRKVAEDVENGITPPTRPANSEESAGNGSTAAKSQVFPRCLMILPTPGTCRSCD